MTAPGRAPKHITAVRGFCPMGCGATLMLTAGGEIRCWEFHCPNKTAAAQILADSESDHLVTLSAGGFTVKHPLRERLGDQVLACNIAPKLAELPGEERPEGVFRAWQKTDELDADPAWYLIPVT